MEKEQEVRSVLQSLSEESYRKFAASLIPGCDNMLGVRIPKLRTLAKRMAKENPLPYLQEAQELYFEETMLKGLIVGNLTGDIETVLEQAALFVPKITNWSLCDSFCAELKITRKYPERVWEFLQPYWQSRQPYHVRFAVVMMLDYYVDKEHLPQLFSIFDRIRHPDYYVKMAVAWAVSLCYVRFPEESADYLRHNQLDAFTYEKALQKIRESRRVDPAVKAQLRTMAKSRGGKGMTGNSEKSTKKA